MSDDDSRLDEIIARIEETVTIDVTHWCAEHPRYADAIREYVANRQVVRGFREMPERMGDYVILDKIGEGGMGVVYRAHQENVERVVAVKTIRGGRIASVRDVQRFHTEARLVARLRHPNIVTVHTVGEQDGCHYFAMEYVEGTNLAALIGGEAMEPQQAARYLVHVAEAVHYAHEHQVLHRDLKPSNILIDQDDRPRITDFGLAKDVRSGAAAERAILGTPSYMAPEQAEGRLADVDERSDVYSLGVVMYEALTGRVPFRGKSMEETLEHVVSGPPVALRSVRPEVPADLEAISLKCLKKDPGERYATAKELAEDLRRYLNGDAVSARPSSAFDTIRRELRAFTLQASVARVGLVAGPMLGALVAFAMSGGSSPEGQMAGLMAWVAVWWLTEAVPSGATALLPLIVMPLAGIVPLEQVSRLYMHDVILLTLGGSLIGIAVEESGLARRAGLRILALAKNRPRRVVLGLMIVTGFVSMWIANVAAALMMLPIALGILAQVNETADGDARNPNLTVASILGIVYAATIGGTATPVGTPALASLALGWGWMKAALPFAACMGWLTWVALTRWLFPVGSEPVKELRTGCGAGPLSGTERRVLAIAAAAPALWMFSAPWSGFGWAPVVGLSGRAGNAVAALGLALLCFLVPSGGKRTRRLLEWDSTSRLPWGAIFLFGAGLALAEGVNATGLHLLLTDSLASALGRVPTELGKTLGATAFTASLTQMISNLGVVEMTTPILRDVAPLVQAGAFGAFCSFLLPAATPANALAYGTGKVTVRQMMRAGIVLAPAGVVLGAVLAYFFS